MKKLFTLIAASIFGLLSAGASEFNPTGTTPIYNQPTGEVTEKLWWTSVGYSSSWMGLEAFSEDGLVSKIVTNGDSVFIYHPLSQLKSSSWIGGKLNGDELTISLPFPIYEQDGETYYLSAMKLKFSDDGATYVPIDDNHATFIRHGDSLTLDKGQVLGLVDSTGEWYGYADSAICIARPQLPNVKVPSTAKRQTYLISVVDDYGKKTTTPVVMAFDGNDVYMSNPESSDTTVWARGTLKDGEITFEDGQYLGVDSADNHFTFLRSGTKMVESDPEWGDYTTYTLSGMPIVFKYISTDKTMSCDSVFMVCRGNKAADILAAYDDAALNPFDEVAATPAAPEIISYSPTDPEYNNPAYFAYQIKAEDTEGNYILPNKMYFEVFSGKNPDEPLTFSPSDYTALKQTMTQIPLNFTDGQDINQGYINLHGVVSDSIGIQVFYTGGGETRSSEKVWYSYSAVSGIESVEDNQNITSERYYDLSGREVGPNAKGILIRKTTYKSGHTLTTKIIR